MDGRGTASGPNAEKGKAARGRRSWSKFEEDALIGCLLDIVNDGWKAENGFKAGFQRELEKNMRKMLPGTDIVAHPHINSKIHVWKKEYGALSDLLSKSDRATGANAVDPLDLFHELRGVDLEQAGESDDKYVPRTTDILNEVDDNSICKPTNSVKRACSKGKKRKSGDADLSTLVDSLSDFMKFSKEAMTKEAVYNTKLDAQKDSGSKNDQVKLIESLKGIDGLKVTDKLKVCDELVQNALRLELFLSLPPDEQEEYVWMLLDGRL
ncbi:hypothetical protein ACS0TY_001329 [Phlomoides rotata]